MATWGETHFGGLELGDQRRSRRLPQLVDAICRHPGGTLPEKLSEPGNLRAFYRLMKAKEVTHEAVLATHYAVTRTAIAEACASGAVVLVLHDATELDFTSKTTLFDHLGQIGEGTHRGYICHNSLAVRADTKVALGLASRSGPAAASSCVRARTASCSTRSTNSVISSKRSAPRRASSNGIWRFPPAPDGRHGRPA